MSWKVEVGGKRTRTRRREGSATTVAVVAGGRRVVER